MNGTIRTTTVQGQTYDVWSDFVRRATLARRCDTGEVKVICGGGYIHKDLTVRKAIALCFGHSNFNK